MESHFLGFNLTARKGAAGKEPAESHHRRCPAGSRALVLGDRTACLAWLLRLCPLVPGPQTLPPAQTPGHVPQLPLLSAEGRPATREGTAKLCGLRCHSGFAPFRTDPLISDAQQLTGAALSCDRSPAWRFAPWNPLRHPQGQCPSCLVLVTRALLVPGTHPSVHRRDSWCPLLSLQRSPDPAVEPPGVQAS